MGVVATVCDLVALAVLVHGFGLSPRLANAPALLIGLGVQFVGNKRFAFRDRSRRYIQQGAAFAFVEAGAFALNVLAFDVLVRFSTPWAAARLVASAVVYVGFSYPLWRLIFRSETVRRREIDPCSTAS